MCAGYFYSNLIRRRARRRSADSAQEKGISKEKNTLSASHRMHKHNPRVMYISTFSDQQSGSLLLDRYTPFNLYGATRPSEGMHGRYPHAIRQMRDGLSDESFRRTNIASEVLSYGSRRRLSRMDRQLCQYFTYDACLCA